jgi:hypothetical protein
MVGWMVASVAKLWQCNRDPCCISQTSLSGPGETCSDASRTVGCVAGSDRTWEATAVLNTGYLDSLMRECRYATCSMLLEG